MRKPEKMLALLEAMRKTPNGQTVIAPGRFGLSEEQQEEQHHAALLVDAGLAEWTGDGKTILRITYDGHGLIEKLEQDVRWHTKFCDLLKSGKSVIDAMATVMTAIELAT